MDLEEWFKELIEKFKDDPEYIKEYEELEESEWLIESVLR